MLVGIAAFLFCLVALLAVPLDLMFAVHRRESLFRGSIAAGWLYGLVRIPIRAKRGARRPRKRKAKKHKPKREVGRRVIATLRSAPFRWRLLRFAGDAFHSVHVHNLDLGIRFGFDDPADTGRFWGMLYPGTRLLERWPRTKFDFELNFERACLEFDAEGAVRVIPIQVIWATVIFLLSPSTLKAAWILASGRT
jgi:hypothetical protein